MCNIERCDNGKKLFSIMELEGHFHVSMKSSESEVAPNQFWGLFSGRDRVLMVSSYLSFYFSYKIPIGSRVS